MKQKILVLGISHSKGVSKKSGKDYSIQKLYAVKETKGWGDEGSEQGFEGDEYNISEDAYESLASQKLPFPCVCYLTFGINAQKQVFVTSVEKA